MSTLITGIQGVIGSQLAQIMTERNIPIHPKSFTFDVCNFLYSDLEGVEKIIHLAAWGVNLKDRNWPQCMAVNVNGGVAVLRRASSLGIPILFARTFLEDAVHEHPSLKMDPYFGSKALFYDVAQHWDGAINFARIFQVYGPTCNGVLGYAKERFSTGSPATFGSGIALKDWIHIKDAAEGILYASENQLNIDIGTGRMTSVRDAVELLHREMLSDSEMTFDPEQDRGDIQVRIRATLNSWKPRISLEDGIKELAQT